MLIIFELIFWAIFFVSAIIIESYSTQLISIWFALGALCSFVLSLFQPDFLIQFIVFVVVSFVCLLLTRPFIKKFTIKNNQPTNVDMIINSCGIVIETIDNLKDNGRIKVGDLSWKAKSLNNDIIQLNEEICVKKIEGVTAYVIKKNN